MSSLLQYALIMSLEYVCVIKLSSAALRTLKVVKRPWSSKIKSTALFPLAGY